MKNKLILLLLMILLSSYFAHAHNVDYSNQILKTWSVGQNHKEITASFLLFKDNLVYLEDASHKIIKVPIDELSKQDQQLVWSKYNKILGLNSKPTISVAENSTILSNTIIKLVILSVLVAAFCFYVFMYSDKKLHKYLAPIAIIGFIGISYGFTAKILPQILAKSDPKYLDSAFVPFKSKISTRWDNSYFYVESNGIPDHEMMVGITGWQQQFPLPQCYIGSNAWSIPLNTEIASSPVPVNQNHFLRGAVAVAVNGIAIFNPYTNTGVDALLDGQLDNFGGHCGRADDYHYHIAPLHLYSQSSLNLPIAFALDGFAVYGSKEADGSDMLPLDTNHGHFGINGIYHYHGTKAAPYMIGNMVGKVTEDNTMQIVPQAAAKPIREAGTPLKGAVITKCEANSSSNGYILSYTLASQLYKVDFSWDWLGNYTFNYINPNSTNTQKYKSNSTCKAPSSDVEDFNLIENEVSLYPNPSKGLLNFDFRNTDMEGKVKQILIFDMNGRLLLNFDHNLQNIDIKSLAKGNYIVKLQMPTYQISKKLIVN
jgi:hypothetical protein